jgi:hypothetical protein
MTSLRLAPINRNLNLVSSLPTNFLQSQNVTIQSPPLNFSEIKLDKSIVESLQEKLKKQPDMQGEGLFNDQEISKLYKMYKGGTLVCPPEQDKSKCTGDRSFYDIANDSLANTIAALKNSVEILSEENGLSTAQQQCIGGNFLITALENSNQVLQNLKKSSEAFKAFDTKAKSNNIYTDAAQYKQAFDIETFLTTRIKEASTLNEILSSYVNGHGVSKQTACISDK